MGVRPRFVEVEDQGAGAVGNGGAHLPEGEAERLPDGEDGEDSGEDQEKGLHQIGPDDGFYASPEGVGPDDRHGEERVARKRNAERPEHGKLQHQCNDKEPETGADDFGEQEEPGAGFVGTVAEPFFDVGVDGGQVEFVVERQKQLGDEEVTDKVSQNDGEVGHFGGRGDHARHGNKGDAGEGCSDHAERYCPPRGFAAAFVEVGSGAFTGNPPGERQEQAEIEDDDGEEEPGCHGVLGWGIQIKRTAKKEGMVHTATHRKKWK